MTDAGSLGFAKPMYEFSCNDKQLLIPVHRSSGADGTVSVPWFTRDGSAVGKLEQTIFQHSIIHNVH